MTFFSPKGGVGRTTIATNLAVALHQTTRQPVVLVDGSLPFGDVGVLLNISPKAKTIADLIGSFETMDVEMLESILVPHSTGIKVLLAPPTPESTELITGTHLKHVLETLREHYAYVVVDTWPTFQEQVLGILDTIAFTIRERVRIKGEIGTLTAQDRMSGYLVALLSIALAAGINALNPDFMRPLFTQLIGQLLIGISLVCMTIGFLVIQKITDIKV